MRNLLGATAMVVTVLLAQTVSPVHGADKRIVEELLRLEAQWNDAYNRHDKEGVGRILREDYMLIDADAYVLNKSQYLDTLSRVQVKSEELKYPDVRVYGDAAIVISIWSGMYSFEGKDTTDTIRYTDFFIKENGKWQAVASQGTRIPKR